MICFVSFYNPLFVPVCSTCPGGEASLLWGGGLHGTGEHLLDGWGEVAQEVTDGDAPARWRHNKKGETRCFFMGERTSLIYGSTRLDDQIKMDDYGELLDGTSFLIRMM